MPQPKVAVVGCGYWGQNLVRNFSEHGALAAVCDESLEISRSFSDKYNVVAASFDEILAISSIDGVVIAAPAAQHGELAARALTAGKHVFVEKPLALDVATADSLCALAEARQLTLMVGHLLRYHAAFQKLEELVKDGELGNLRFIASTRLNLGKIRREEDILWSFAPHDISMVLALMGTEPSSARADGSAFLGDKIADVTTTNLEFPGGEKAHIFVSWLHPYKEQRLVVVGDAAMAVFDDTEGWDRKLALYRHRVDWVDGLPSPVKADGEFVALTPTEPLAVETRHFLDCIASGDAPLTDGREGLRVLRVLSEATRTMTSNEDIHPTAVIDDGAVIGENTKVWHFSHILRDAHVGAHCSLGQNVMIGEGVAIGDRCKIQNNVSIYSGVTLEDGVFCGPSCVFTNVTTPRAEVNRRDEFAPTLVRRGATIGANATIVCGVTLGEYSFIAAGAVVTSDVANFALVAGVPARQMGWVSRAGERLGADLVCPRTGERYVEVDGQLHVVEA